MLDIADTPDHNNTLDMTCRTDVVRGYAAFGWLGLAHHHLGCWQFQLSVSWLLPEPCTLQLLFPRSDLFFEEVFNSVPFEETLYDLVVNVFLGALIGAKLACLIASSRRETKGLPWLLHSSTESSPLHQFVDLTLYILLDGGHDSCCAGSLGCRESKLVNNRHSFT